MVTAVTPFCVLVLLEETEHSTFKEVGVALSLGSVVVDVACLFGGLGTGGDGVADASFGGVGFWCLPPSSRDMVVPIGGGKQHSVSC